MLINATFEVHIFFNDYGFFFYLPEFFFFFFVEFKVVFFSF